MLLFSRLMLGGSVLAAALCLAGCVFPLDLSDDATRPADSTTTDMKVAPTGKGVAMRNLTGKWFFLLRTADGEAVFTQKGNFALREDGKIVYDDTWYVQGFKADEIGLLRTDKLRDLKIVFGQESPVRSTKQVQLEGNINPEDAEVGDVTTAKFKVYGAGGVGATIHVSVMLIAKDDSSTQLRFDIRLGSADGTPLALVGYQFGSDGALEGASKLQVTSNAPLLSFEFDLGGVMASSQRDTSLAMTDQDGVGAGTLKSYSIQQDGMIIGHFTNGVKLPVGQYVVASFETPSQLAPVSGRSDVFTQTDASGPPHPAVSVAE